MTLFSRNVKMSEINSVPLSSVDVILRNAKVVILDLRVLKRMSNFTGFKGLKDPS